jgi:Uma2 family endonuclease
MTISTPSQPTQPSLTEGMSILDGIGWQQFKTIDMALGDRKGVKLAYLNGLLEIMSPIGQAHEDKKSTLGVLLEAYWRETGIRFYRTGGFTLESPETSSGTPDESYCINTRKDIPDLVIEVIITSGKIDKKELYRPQRVPEVWFWKKNQITVFQLQNDVYVQCDRSQFLPNLDLLLLSQWVDAPDQYDAVNELIQYVRQRLP